MGSIKIRDIVLVPGKDLSACFTLILVGIRTSNLKCFFENTFLNVLKSKI